MPWQPPLPPAQILRSEFPVGELVEHGLYIVDASILVVEIVGVFPYVDGQQWFRSLCNGGIGIARLDDFELIAILSEPRPAAAELLDRRMQQFLFAPLDAAERRLHQTLEDCRWLAAAPRLETSPVKRVIPYLRCIVENGGLVRVTRRRPDDLLERLVCQLGAR